MGLKLLVYERNLLGKKRNKKILGEIHLSDKVETFIFGRNDMTRDFFKRIDDYAYIQEKQGTFLKDHEGYKFIDTSKKGILLRTHFSFWIFDFGEKETLFERSATLIEVGDQIVSRPENNPKKDLVLEVMDIY